MNLSRGTMTVSRTSDLQPAGFWLRVFAFILDSTVFTAILTLIIWGIIASFGVAIYTYMEKHHFEKAALQNLGAMMSPYGSILTNSNVIVLILFSPLFLYILYYTFFEASFLQATPGKLALGLVVTNPHDDRTSFGSAFMRNVYKFLPNFLPILGLMVIAFAVTMRIMSLTLILGVGLGSIGASILLSIVMYGSIGWTEFKQGLHDRWSYCYVQKKMSTPSLQRQGFSLLAIALFCLFVFKGHAENEKHSKFSFKMPGSTKTKSQTVAPEIPLSLKSDIEKMKKKMEEQVVTALQKKEKTPEKKVEEKVEKETYFTQEFPSDSQEKSLRVLKRGNEIDLGGTRNATTGHVEERPVLYESASGDLRVGKKRIQITRARASIRDGKQLIDVLIYGKAGSGSEYSQPIMKLLFYYKTSAGSCQDRSLQKYLVKINAQYFELPHVKKGEYLTFTRRGGDINLNEKMVVSCQREPDSGWVRLNGTGREAALLYGTRYPVHWNVNVEDSF